MGAVSRCCKRFSIAGAAKEIIGRAMHTAWDGELFLEGKARGRTTGCQFSPTRSAISVVGIAPCGGPPSFPCDTAS